jgi:hypothetical protein
MLVNNIFNWWIGVVEDRFDPQQLGRVRVRIVGIHSDDKEILPTKDLPWAIAMQPSTSAAISGIGSTPLGLLPGSWCIGFFIDGDDMQQPVIMGTIGSLSQPNPVCQIQQNTDALNTPNVLRAETGAPVLDADGKPIEVTPEKTTNSAEAIASTLPPLTQEQIQKLMDALGFKESSSVAGGAQNYSTVNRANYIGKYQFGAPALATLGYVKIPQGGSLSNDRLNDASAWTGKDGLTSKEAFFANGPAQEKIMFENLKFNYGVMSRNGTINANDPPEKVAGLLATAHLLGAGGATSYAQGRDSRDGNGTSGAAYYRVGALAVGTEVPNPEKEGEKIQPYQNPAGPLNNPLAAAPRAFADPNNEFPRCDYFGLPDTNKLATGVTAGTAVEQKIKRLRENITTADGKQWSEPKPAYCAQYPYNQTFQTEAGHIVEFDSTPGQERVHLYHKAGTYIEIDVNGTMVRKVIGDNYEILEQNNKLYVRGAYSLTVEGATQILVKNDCDLKVFGDTNATFHNDINMNVGGDFNLNVGGSFNVKGGRVNFTTDGEFEARSGGSVQLTSDGGNFDVIANNIYLDLNRSGGQIRVDDGFATEASSNELGDAVDTLTVENISMSPLNRPDCSPQAFTLDAGEVGAQEIHQAQVASGEVVPTVPTESGEAAPTTQTQESTTCDCTEFNSFNEFPDTLKLSRYYNLGELSSRAIVVKEKVTAQRGFTVAQIVCNLKNLSVNCLDKIKTKYPDMIVTNAFRLDKPGKSSSDHGAGMAADIQFTKASASDYYTIVQWIAENVPYKQILLEYGGGARMPWIHIAYDKSGQKAPLPYATFKDHGVYARNKFVNLA